MSHQVDIHQAQTNILRELLFVPKASFTDLQKESGLDADHCKFHIARLVELGYVYKVSYGVYALTQQGKEHANKLDTDTNTMERQPKISVALILERTNNDGQKEYLCQQRLKNPYYGFWGRLGGKVQWGESFEEAATRELKEETGLDGEFELGLVYRKRDYSNDDGHLLEDKVFMVMRCVKHSGNLIEKFEGGYNKWMTQEEFAAQEHKFESAYDFIGHLESGKQYVQKEFHYSNDEY